MEKNSSSQQAAKTSAKWRKIISIATLIALGLVIFFSRDKIVETYDNMRLVDLGVLSFMVVWQILNYHFYAELYRSLLGILGNKLRYRDLYSVAVELNFVNHVFPSGGVSGFSYFGLRLKQFNVSPSNATVVQMMRFVTVFLSFQLLLFGGLLMLALDGGANNLTILVASSIGTMLAIGTALMVYIVGSKRRIDAFLTALTKFLNRLLYLVRPKHPETINVANARKWFLELHEDYKIIRKNYGALKRPLVFAFFANFTEVATIYTVYVAFGEPVNPGAVIIAYAVANFAGLISVLPGGIGVYEALTAAVLAAAGVPPSIGIPATVMYRILSSLIQLPPGYFLYHRVLNRRDKPLL